jgi:hypothetical protein
MPPSFFHLFLFKNEFLFNYHCVSFLVLYFFMPFILKYILISL